MNDLAELKRRVDSAVDHLAAAQNARRQQQDSLIQLLADLEVKFDARHQELVHCHSRITDLEETNTQLTELLTTVVRLIESGSVEDSNDVIFRASKMAADLVSLCASKPIPGQGSGRERSSESEMVTVEAKVIDDYPRILRSPGGEAPAEGPFGRAESRPGPETVAETDQVFQRAEAQRHSQADSRSEVETVTTREAEYETQLPGEEERTRAAARAEDGPSASGHSPNFDDVSDDELEVETLLDGVPEEDAMPRALVQAMEEAAEHDDGGREGDNIADRLAEVSSAVETARRAEPERHAAEPPVRADDHGLDDPGMDTVVDFDVMDVDELATVEANDDPLIVEGDDTDIKALMARIQEAAEKARSRSDAREVASSNRPPSPNDKTGTH